MIEVFVNAKDVLKSFDQLELRKQDNLLRKAYYEGAGIIAKGAVYGLMGYFKGRNDSKKIYSMAKSIKYSYNKRGQFVSIYPSESEYYGYMTKWFIAGTRNRWSYTREARRRSSGALTKRRYKAKKKHFFGALPGNNVIVASYNANIKMANEVIKQSFEKQFNKIWNKNGG